MIKEGELILLIGKEGRILVKAKKQKLQSRFGIFDLSKVIGKKYGTKIKSHLGKEFWVVKPTLKDFFEKYAKRLPQVVVEKDLALMLAYSMPRNNIKILDCGTGSAFLAMFLGYYLSKAKIISYEIRKDFAKIAKENLANFGISNVRVKIGDVSRAREKGFDLITVDLKNPERLVEKLYAKLNPAGYLIFYCPTIDEMVRVIKKLKKLSLAELLILENFVREWQVTKTIRPKTIGIMHTGFLVIGRKV